MDTDLKNMDGEPADVAQASVVALISAHDKYQAALKEATLYVRNAAMDEVPQNVDDLAAAWAESWEARILALLRTKAESHAGVLAKLLEIVDNYEGYGE